MKVSRTNAGLIVALVPLITLLLWDVARGREPVTLTVVWPAVLAGEVDGLRIVNESGEVNARRVGTQWTVVAPSGDGGEPVSMAADPDLIRGVLRSFRSPIRPDARVATRADDPATFGLADGERIEVEFRVTGEVVLALEIGRPLAGGVSFARPVGEDAVYRARIPGRYRLEKPLAEWRDHRVTALGKGKVVSLTIEGGGDIWHYQRRTEDWACLEEPEMLLDVQLVEGMARTAAELRASAILDASHEDAFEPLRLRLVAANHEGAEQTVEFGATTADGREVFARRGGQVFRVPLANLETLERAPGELRDRDVVKLDWKEVERVTVVQGTRRFVAEPTGEHAWRLVEPEGYSIDARQLGFSLDAMLELRAFALVDESSRRESGVDAPEALQIHIERVEAAPVDVRVGPLAGSVHHVWREGRDQVYSLRVSTARSLTQGLGLDWEK
jgi:hypothetical protein